MKPLKFVHKWYQNVVIFAVLFIISNGQRYDGRFLIFNKHNRAFSPSAETIPHAGEAVSTNSSWDQVRTRPSESDERLTETVRRYLFERGEFLEESLVRAKLKEYEHGRQPTHSVKLNESLYLSAPTLHNGTNKIDGSAASDKDLPVEANMFAAEHITSALDDRNLAVGVKNSALAHLSNVNNYAMQVENTTTKAGNLKVDFNHDSGNNNFKANDASDSEKPSINTSFILVNSSDDDTEITANSTPTAAFKASATDESMGGRQMNEVFGAKAESQELYKVLRVIPEMGQQLAFLDRLEHHDADLRINFWTSPIRVGSAVDIMVPYEKLAQLRQLLAENDLEPNVIIEDVEKLIIEREQKSKKSFGRRFRDEMPNSENENPNPQRETEKNRRSLPSSLLTMTADAKTQPSALIATDEAMAEANAALKMSAASISPQGRQGLRAATVNDAYDFHRYGSYTQMVAWMRSLAHRHPNFVQFISIGKTHEGRSIDGLEIGTRGLRKRAFWIDGGIHAREWAAPHTALYFIHQLTSRYGRDPNITRLVSEITWIIIPLLNPDGYEYTRLSTNPNVRLWRKNRAPTHCIVDQWGRNRCCKGVDLNRNFDFHFKESGSSDDPCSEIYQGKGPFSEPEARAVRDAILSSRYRGRVDGFITLHTYSQIWIHPYGHKKDSYPGDVQDLYSVGKKATVALSKLYGTKYILGSGADTLYPASGGSEDWAKESAAIKFVYLLELRPDERSWDGFILEETQLIPTASETWAGVKVVADAIIQRAKNRIHPHRISGTRQYRFGDGTPGSCYDMRHACKRWIQESETLCKTVPVFMREQCAYSCGFC